MPIDSNIPQCRHVRTNGIRCGSPAMRSQDLCFYHIRTTRPPKARPNSVPPLVEDGNAIQFGIANVLLRLEAGNIDYKAAALQLYGYQLASQNLRNVDVTPFQDRVVIIDPSEDSGNPGDDAEPLTLAEEFGSSYERNPERVQAGKDLVFYGLPKKRTGS